MYQWFAETLTANSLSCRLVWTGPSLPCPLPSACGLLKQEEMELGPKAVCLHIDRSSSYLYQCYGRLSHPLNKPHSFPHFTAQTPTDLFGLS